MLRIHHEPNLRDPVVLCAFTGWSDAGLAGTTAVRYLAAKHQGTLIADFDPDAIFNYGVTRPLTSIGELGRRDLRWPALEWTAVPMQDLPHDLVLINGPEPDLRWRACAEEVGSFVQHLGVKLLIGLGSFYASVPHIGPSMLIGQSPNSALRLRLTMLGLRDSSYEGATGFLTAAVDAANEVAIPACSIWGATPSYLHGTTNAKVAAALLGAVERLLGQDLDKANLELAGKDMEAQVTEALRKRPDLSKFVERLEEKMGEAAPEDSVAPPENYELPPAEELLKDIEDHLRKMRQDPPQD